MMASIMLSNADFKLLEEYNRTVTIAKHDAIINTCETCGCVDSFITDAAAGYKACSNCGRVINNDILDSNPEWKACDVGNSQPRCSGTTNSLLPQTSLSTTIGHGCNYRIRSLHNWNVMPYKERSLNIVLDIIKKKCESAGLITCIEDDAKILYKIATEYTDPSKAGHPIIRGGNKKGLIAACVLYACKRKDNARNLKEIANLFDMKPTRVNRGCKNFVKFVKYTNIDYGVNLSHPSQYIQHYCNIKHLDDDIVNDITTISDNVRKMNIIQSHTPISLAAACIMLYSKKSGKIDVNKSDLASVFKISEVTLVKTFANLCEYEGIIFDDDKIDEIMRAPCNMPCPKFLLDRLQRIKNISVKNYSDSVNIDILISMDISTSNYLIDMYNKCREYV